MNSKVLLAGVGGFAALVLALTVLLGSWFTIDQGELGVRLRAGAVVGVEEPGLGFKVPLIERIVELSMRTQKVSYDEVLAYSKDIQVADLRISVNFRLDPAKVTEIYAELGTNYVDSILSPAVFNVTKVVFGQFTAVSVVAERARLVQEVSAAIHDLVENRGIIVESVNLENIDFSDEYERSIEARMQAEVEVTRFQQNLARQKVQADIVRTDAEGKADAVRVAAKAEADAIRLRGEAEAAAIIARSEALKQNANLIELVKAERWNGVLPTTMLPGQTVPFIGVK